MKTPLATPLRAEEGVHGWFIIDANGEIVASHMNRGRDMGESDAKLIVNLVNSMAGPVFEKPIAERIQERVQEHNRRIRVHGEDEE